MDISTQKDLHKFYQSSFANLVNYTYLLDNQGYVIFCSKNLLDIFNLEKVPDNTVGIMYSLMLNNHFGNQTQLSLHKKLDIEAIVSEKAMLSDKPAEFWINNQKTHMFTVNRTPILSASGRPQGLLVEMIDVSETVYLHEQLDKIRKELAYKNEKAADALTFTSIPINNKQTKQKIMQQSPLVLVIEDDEIAQKSVKSVLMHCNFDVHFAHDEKEFNALFKPGKYQLVFMDIGLEETSGYMIAKSIRKIENNSKYHVPIIALTGYDPKNLTGDCNYYSMEGAIQKPLTMTQASEINQRYIRQIDIDITGLEAAKPNA